MQWPHYHNLCWYHGFTPPPISARHFHHLLGTEFHHSRHSCPPSLPSLPPSSSSSFCTTIKFVPTALLLLSFLVRGPLCGPHYLCLYFVFVFLFFKFVFPCWRYQTGRYQSGAWRRYVLLHMKWWLTDIVRFYESFCADRVSSGRSVDGLKG